MSSLARLVRLEVTDGIGTIRLDRPPVNALNDELVAALSVCALAASEDPAVRAVIVYGGPKVFAAGADIKEMASAGYAAMSVRSGRLQTAVGQVAAIGKPVVAAITGYALGGGLELALACDFRVCGSGARVGQPEIQLGVIPGAGGTQRLPRLIGPSRAKDLVFSGRMVDAPEALSLGLVDRVVDDSDVYSACVEMMSKYVSGPGLALRAAKQAIDHGLDVDLATGLEYERVHFAALFATEDQREGMQSFLTNGPNQATFKSQ